MGSHHAHLYSPVWLRLLKLWHRTYRIVGTRQNTYRIVGTCSRTSYLFRTRGKRCALGETFENHSSQNQNYYFPPLGFFVFAPWNVLAIVTVFVIGYGSAAKAVYCCSREEDRDVQVDVAHTAEDATHNAKNLTSVSMVLSRRPLRQSFFLNILWRKGVSFV